LIVFLFAGCFRAGLFFWSPDGSKAILNSDENWYVIAEPDFQPISLGAQCRYAQWMPDSKRAILLVEKEFQDWASLKPLLSPAELESVTEIAEELKTIVRDTPQGQKPDVPEEKLERDAPGMLQAAILMVRDTADENLKARLHLWRENLATATASMTTIALAEIGSGSDIPSGTQELMTLLIDSGEDDLSVQVEPSPSGRAAALLVLQAGQTLGDFQPIYSVSLFDPNRPGPIVRVDEKAGFYVAWNREGSQLAWFRYKGDPPASKEEGELARLGDLVTLDVAFDEQGRLAQTQPAPTARVGGLFYSLARMHYAPDGSLFFMTPEVRLPATAGDMPQGVSLFRWDPRYPEVVQPALNREMMKSIASGAFENGAFSLSPDGKKITVFGLESLAICDLGTGSVQPIPDTEPGILLFEAGWRNDREIVAVTKPGHEAGSPERGEMVLFDAGSGKAVRCLSKNWPEEVAEDWFGDK
jgi:hypothetical protein